MKFRVGSKETGYHFKYKIERRYEKNGTFISVAEVRDFFRENPEDEEYQIGWDGDIALSKRMRVRQCKDGWYLYLPEPNAKICFNKKKKDNEKCKAVATIEPPDIDVTVLETEAFEKLIDQLVCLRETLEQKLSHLEIAILNSIGRGTGYTYRDCIVKAKKSGRKEERQDRNAKFHRWADLSKGVQQVVAIVEFDDGHVEQVQPDRIIFKEGE